MSNRIFKKTKEHKINKTTSMGITASGKSRNSKVVSKKIFSPRNTRNAW
jgi:hypothetical protein